jgi:hypothetical protein
VPNKTEQTPIKPSKIALICFYLFTFIFSKRAISMSYRRLKQKIFSCFCMPAPVVNTAALLGHGLVGRGLGALRGSSLSSPKL